MNLVTLITGIVIAMAVFELLLHGMPRMKRDLFIVAVLVAWGGFTSKYYYGPDIVIYSLLYDESWSLWDLVFGHYTGGYEIGYMFFNALCKALGISFWGMTALISTLFFLAVFMVLRRLKDKRVLALALVLVLLKDLIYAQFRQCLAVSFFTFAVIEAEGWRNSGFARRKDALFAVVLGLIAMSMHKSGMFMIPLTAVYYALQPYKMRQNTWGVLLMILLMLVIVPTWSLIEFMTETLNLDPMVMDSIRLHLSFVNLRQTNLLVYGTVLVVLTCYARGQERKGFAIASASFGMIVIVLLYQYYFMVDRLRSYFVLLIVYYAFNVMREAAVNHAPYVNLVRQVCEVVLLFFMIGKTYSFDKSSRIEQGDLLDACTLFNLIDEDPWTVRQRQMEKGQRFWNSSQRSDTRYMIPAKETR